MFVALMLGPEAGDELEAQVAASLGREDEELRRYGGDDLHMTLFFLGAVAGELRPDLEQALRGALDPSLAPDLVLSTPGAFPGPERPRILWVGVDEEGPERLHELERSVRRACVGQGFTADPRPFAAHVTVARVARRARGWQAPAAFFHLKCAIPWQPPGVALVESLPPGGPTAYRPVRVFPFSSGH